MVTENTENRSRREESSSAQPHDGQYRASFDALMRIVSILHGSGVQLVAGTDALAGFTLHRELENYVKRAYTLQRCSRSPPGMQPGREKESGTIATGKLADLVVLDRDPSIDISALRQIRWTVKGGVICEAAPLLRAVSPLCRRRTLRFEQPPFLGRESHCDMLW